jgi:hypothetical protein
MLANAIVYFNPATSLHRSSCPDPLYVLQGMELAQPTTHEHKHKLLHRHSGYSKSITELDETSHQFATGLVLAMGLWWEPQLHGVPPVSPFHGIVIPAKQQPHQGVFPLDMEHSPELYDCATEGRGYDALGDLCKDIFRSSSRI